MSKRILMVSLLALTAAYNLTYAAGREEHGAERRRLVNRGLDEQNKYLAAQTRLVGLEAQEAALRVRELQEKEADRARARQKAEQEEADRARAREKAEADREAAAQRKREKAKEDALRQSKITEALAFLAAWCREDSQRLDHFMQEVIGLYNRKLAFPDKLEELLRRKKTIEKALEIGKQRLLEVSDRKIADGIRSKLSRGIAAYTYDEAAKIVTKTNQIRESHQQELRSEKKALLLKNGVAPSEFTEGEIDAMSTDQIIQRFGSTRK